MASDWTSLGSVRDSYLDEVGILRHERGAVALQSPYGQLVFEPGELAALRELLDRAAMPGQVPPAASRWPVYGCCEHCEHCGLCSRPGHCEHGYDQPPHLGPCAFGDCGPGNTAAGEVIVTAGGRDRERPLAAGEAGGGE